MSLELNDDCQNCEELLSELWTELNPDAFTYPGYDLKQLKAPDPHIVKRILSTMGLPVENKVSCEKTLNDIKKVAAEQFVSPTVVHKQKSSELSILCTIPNALDFGFFRATIVPTASNSEVGKVAVTLKLGELIGQPGTCTIEGRGYQDFLAPIPLPKLPLGSYTLMSTLTLGGDELKTAESRLIVCPDKSYLHPELALGEKIWGISAQMYSLKRDTSKGWGIGDFTDAAELLSSAGKLGAKLVGFNPLAVLNHRDPNFGSPYSPTSRTEWNILYTDIEAVPEYTLAQSAIEHDKSITAARSRAEASRHTEFGETVDFQAVAEAKMAAFEILYNSFVLNDLSAGTERAKAFHKFCEQKGQTIEKYALYEAIQDSQQEQFPQDVIWGWPSWRDEKHQRVLNDPFSVEVEEFSRGQKNRIQFYKYIQFVTDEQLAALSSHGKREGVRLYLDIPIGTARGSVETWGEEALWSNELSIGAPPDQFADGQRWGLPPIKAQELVRRHYEPYLAPLREAMRHSDYIRIDHVLAVVRLYVMNHEDSPQDGAYLHYPVRELLSLIALESHNNKCVVIGEDLGNVPDGFRELLKESNIFSYKVQQFERSESFGEVVMASPEEYPEASLSSFAIHDTPTMVAYWNGEDIDLKVSLGLVDSEGACGMRHDRQRVRRALLNQLREYGLDKELSFRPGFETPDMDSHLAAALQSLGGLSKSQIQMIDMESLAGDSLPVNVPGVGDKSLYPVFARRQPRSTRDVLEKPFFDVVSAMKKSGRS